MYLKQEIHLVCRHSHRSSDVVGALASLRQANDCRSLPLTRPISQRKYYACRVLNRVINLLQLLTQFAHLRFEHVKPQLRLSRLGLNTDQLTVTTIRYPSQVVFGHDKESDAKREDQGQQQAYQQSFRRLNSYHLVP